MSSGVARQATTKDEAWRQKAPAVEKRVNLGGLFPISFAPITLYRYPVIFTAQAEGARHCTY